MYPGCALEVKLFDGLRRIDQDFAARARLGGCPHCGGPLDSAGWDRKPRGVTLPNGTERRLGLCCRDCRKRVLPASVLFFGRKVYWGTVVLVIVAVRQRRTAGTTWRALRKLFGGTLCKQTLQRWASFFREDVPESVAWRTVRGRISSVVRDEALPVSLLDYLDQTLGPGIRALTVGMSCLSAGAFPAS